MLSRRHNHTDDARQYYQSSSRLHELPIDEAGECGGRGEGGRPAGPYGRAAGILPTPKPMECARSPVAFPPAGSVSVGRNEAASLPRHAEAGRARRLFAWSAGAAAPALRCPCRAAPVAVANEVPRPRGAAWREGGSCCYRHSKALRARATKQRVYLAMRWRAAGRTKECFSFSPGRRWPTEEVG